MDIKAMIKSQHHATLAMLKQAIEKCPDSLWYSDQFQNRYWHLAYHALFYTDLYLSPSEDTFRPWAKHRPNLHSLGPTPWPPHEMPDLSQPYSQAEMLEYLAICQRRVEEQITAVDLHAPSGFEWIPMSKLELQFYIMRHVQLHTGELGERLWEHGGVEIGWVGMVAASAGSPPKIERG